jgi:flagellar biosynthesis anti-sigma factor FlgM
MREFKTGSAAMRIDSNHEPQSAVETGRTSAQSGAATSSSSGASVLGEDQAQLSEAHTQVAALAEQAAQLPEVREEKVQALRQAVSSGQYQAPAEKVAGALLTYLTASPAA